MDKWMQALAESLRNLGFEATADRESVKVAGVTYWGDMGGWKTMFRFRGKKYKFNSSVLPAVIAVIEDLPRAQEYQRRLRERTEGAVTADFLQKEVKWNMIPRIQYSQGKYTLEFWCSDAVLMQEAVRRLKQLAHVEPGEEQVMADYMEEQGFAVYAEELRKAVTNA